MNGLDMESIVQLPPTTLPFITWDNSKTPTMDKESIRRPRLLQTTRRTLTKSTTVENFKMENHTVMEFNDSKKQNIILLSKKENGTKDNSFNRSNFYKW